MHSSNRFPDLEPLESRTLFSAVPLITEFLASNSSGIVDEDGDSSDWIELYNAGDTALDLDGWHLTDDAGNLTQWSFPDVSLASGSYLVVFASSKDRADADGTELHTNFRLGAGGEYLALVEPDGTTVAHAYAPTFPPQSTDVSYGLAQQVTQTTLISEGADARYIVPTGPIAGWNTLGFNDSGWALGPTGIGYEDNTGSATDFTTLIGTTIPSGTTSVYARQSFTLVDSNAIDTLTLRLRYDDGFVAYLNGQQVVARNAPNSPAYNASATGDHPDQDALDLFSFDITDSIGELINGQNNLAVHALNTTGSSDFLIEAELVATTIAVGETSDVGFLTTASPGALNGAAYLGFVEDTAFSLDRGIYAAPISVSVTTPTSGASIAYTLDGSTPTVSASGTIINGMLYSSALTISSTTTLRAIAFRPGFQSTNVDTQTYLFLGDILNQTEVTLDGIGASSQQFLAGLSSIPSVALSTEQGNLFGANGIYSNPQNRGDDWERPVSIEFIDPEDPMLSFQEDAGIRIHGADTRSHAKKNLRLYFRDSYGTSSLNRPVLGAEGLGTFDQLLLRTAGHDAFTSPWSQQAENAAYLRDHFLRASQIAAGGLTAQGRWVHLYLNGSYWGLYNLTERINDDFTADHLGGEKGDYDVITGGNGVTEAIDGNLTAWNDLLNDVIRNSVLTANEKFAHAENTINMDSFVDMMAIRIWAGDVDWLTHGRNKNWLGVKNRNDPSAKWEFQIWDAELSLGHDHTSDFNLDTDISTLDRSNSVGEIYDTLQASSEFRVRFADRLHRLFFNNGVLDVSQSTARWDVMVNTIEHAMVAESARWGDEPGPVSGDDVITPAEWRAQTDWVRNMFLPQRNGIVLNQFRALDLFPDTSHDAPSFAQHGGALPTGQITITNNESAGTVYYTTDGSDPRLVGGGLNASAIEYTGAFTLPDHATVTARLLRGGDWSAKLQADFVIADVPADATNLRVAELHYNPQGPSASEIAAGFTDGDDFEFIELVNTSGQTISIDGVELKNAVAGNALDGVTFTFDLVALNPGERIVVVSDLAAFTERYGSGINVAGEYDGKLSNSGEFVRLTDDSGNDIQRFKYEDGKDPGEESWPTTPDGDGPSLVVINTEGDYNAGNNWAASTTTNGTPGSAEAAGLVGDINDDGFVGVDDLQQLLIYWGDAATSSAGALAADLNNDGTVNSPDLDLVIANFGQGTPPTTPTSGDTTPDDTVDDSTPADTSDDSAENAENTANVGDSGDGDVGVSESENENNNTPAAPATPPRTKPAQPAQLDLMPQRVQRAAASQQTANALMLAKPEERRGTGKPTDALLVSREAQVRRFDAMAIGGVNISSRAF